MGILEGMSLNLVSVVCGSTQITLTFDQNVVLSDTSSLAASWTIVPDDDELAVTPDVLDVQVVGSAILLATSEHTNGRGYTLRLPAEIYNGAGHGLITDLEQPYSGVGTYPYIQLLRGVDERTLDIVFSEAMLEDDATDPSLYIVDGGVEVLGVDVVSPLIYRLTTTKMAAETTYAVSVLAIRDLALNPVTISGTLASSLAAAVAALTGTSLSTPNISQANVNVVAGAAANFTPTNIGAPATSWSLQAGTLPASLSLNTSTGAVTGTLTGTDLLGGDTNLGVYSGLVIRATNGAGDSDTAPFTITIAGAVLPALISLYTFDDADVSGATITDRGPGGNHLTSATSPSSVAGTINQGRHFTRASSQYAERGPPWTNLNPVGGSFTWTASVKVDSHPGEMGIVDRYDAGDPVGGAHAGSAAYEWYVYSGGLLHVFVRTDDGTFYDIAGNAVPIGVWSSVAMRVDRAAGFIAVAQDGVVTALSSHMGGSALTFSFGFVEVGAIFRASRQAFFDGAIDELAYWNVALTDLELATVEWLKRTGVGLRTWMGL